MCRVRFRLLCVITMIGPLTAWTPGKAETMAPPPASTMKFEHHYIDTTLPTFGNNVGDYGQTAVADFDKDGKPDFVLGTLQNPRTLYWYRCEGDFDKWTRHVLGRDALAAVGLAAIDVDGDGWVDVVSSGLWYRNTRKPREQQFERHVFDPDGGGAHDVIAADVDGDGKLDIVTASEGKGILWYKIPADPTKPWAKHRIGPCGHGGLAPAAFGDIAGNGHTDIIFADSWFENKDGKGVEWAAHKNIPMGRVGPFGMCTRCIVVDIDGDGKKEVVVADCDIVESKVAILRNLDGHGGKWSREDLPMSFKYGSLHSLAVADLNNDGRLDIVSNEQEELLPPGRQDPRWVIWENLGGGKFAERIILDARLGGHELQIADLDGDGRIDIFSKVWGPMGWNGCGGKVHVDFLRNVGPLPAKKDK